MTAKSKHSHLKKTPAGESTLLASAVTCDGVGTVNTDPAGAYYMTYAEQIKSPKWQKKRLEILERDKFSCRICNDKESQLHVHHVIYKNELKLWEYRDSLLYTLCDTCHSNIHLINNDAQIAMILTLEKFGMDAIEGLFKLLSEINKK